MNFLWQCPQWPDFHWDDERLSPIIQKIEQLQASLNVKLTMLSVDVRNEIQIDSLADSAVDSALIENEVLDRDSVRSSITQGLNAQAVDWLPSTDPKSAGMASMLLDATLNCQSPVNKDRLVRWQKGLFPPGLPGHSAATGDWRQPDDLMRILASSGGRQEIVYQAVPGADVPAAMTQFLDWFESPGDTHPLLLAAVAHAWFECIHPFLDGNGRVGRAIADLALARADGLPLRAYSLTSHIHRQRNDYYQALQQLSGQNVSMDCTAWCSYFLDAVVSALHEGHANLDRAIIKSRFWHQHGAMSLNARQVKVINHMFEDLGGLVTRMSWVSIAECSRNTAGRDIQDLVVKGILRQVGQGRGTKYRLVPPWDIAE